MLDRNYYNYYPIYSLIHKSNPTIKIINSLLVFIMLIISNQLCLIVSIIYVMSLSILSFIPLKYYFKYLWSFRYLISFIIIILLSLNYSIYLIILNIIKIIIISLNILTVIYTTNSFEIADATNNIIYPFNILFIKLGKLSMFITLFLKIIPTFIISTNIIIENSSLRGVDYNKNIINKCLFIIKSIKLIIIKTINELKRIKDTMKHQLYNPDKKRSNIDKVKISYIEIICLIIMLLCVIISFVGGNL